MYSKALFRNHYSQRGAALVEYSLLIVLISIIAITSVSRLGNSVNCTFQNAMTSMRLGSYSTFCIAEYSEQAGVMSSGGYGSLASGLGAGSISGDGGFD